MILKINIGKQKIILNVQDNMFKQKIEEKKEPELVSETTLEDIVSKLETLITILSKEKPRVNDPKNNDKALLLDISKTLSIFLESQLQINEAIKGGLNVNIPTTNNKELVDAILEHNKLLKLNLVKSYKFDIKKDEDGIKTVLVNSI